MDITFTDVKVTLATESSEEHKADHSYEKITKYNTDMFERIGTVGSDYDQDSADSLIELLIQVEKISPLPRSRKLIEDYILSSGLKLNQY